MLEVLFYLLIFIASLAVLLKGSEWLLLGSERIGLAIGLSPFVVGVSLVAIGTSLPDLLASLLATFQGIPEFAVANGVGSSIVNILLIVGLLAVLSRRIEVEKNLIDLDLPLLAAVVALFTFTAIDGVISLFDTIILLSAYGVYQFYTINQQNSADIAEIVQTLPEDGTRPRHWYEFWRPRQPLRRKIHATDVMLVIAGSALLALGAFYVVDSVKVISDMLAVNSAVITLLVISLGTNLPELTVSIRAAKAGQPEVALGNIIGSNVANALVVVGLPGLISTLYLDQTTLLIGLPFMVTATILFIFSGISRRIHIWEGALYLLIYIVFVGKIFQSL